MHRLFLIPNIGLFDVYDVAVRDWLNKLNEEALKDHLEFPFSLERFFPEDSRHALKSIEEVHSEILRLLDIIDTSSVLLDISVDFTELENKYNKRLLSPLEFWSEYYQLSASSSSSQVLYCIYIKGIIDREIRLIETKEHLPLSVVFYGTDIRTREELIPVYEDAFDKDGEFLLKAAKLINEIDNLRETPEHLWYTAMGEKQMGISYEESEKFYNELLMRLERLLKFKAREHFVKNLRDKAIEYVSAYERFLDHKLREEEIEFSNILDGLNVLVSQSDHSKIVIFCGPMHYYAFLNSLRNEKRLSELGIRLEEIDITSLFDKMKPFLQKDRVMQKNYGIALNILDRKMPEKFHASDQ